MSSRTFLTFLAINTILWACGVSYAQLTKSPETELVASQCWNYVPVVPASRLAVSNTSIYLGTDTARIDALLPNGDRLWSSELGGQLISNIVAVENGVLFVTSVQNSDRTQTLLRSLSKETGITSFSVTMPPADQFFLSEHGGSTIVVARNGVVMAIDRNGSAKWKREIAESFTAEPFFKDGKVVIGTTARQIFTIDLVTGEIESLRRSATDIKVVAITPNREVAIGDDRGNLSLMNGTEKAVWKFRSGGAISRIFILGSQIIAASHDNFVYQLLISNGDVEWKKRLAGRVHKMGIINGKYVLTAGLDERAAVITDLTTGKVAGQVPLAEDETLAASPLSLDSSVLLLTNKALYRYSFGNCLEMRKAAGK